MACSRACVFYFTSNAAVLVALATNSEVHWTAARGLRLCIAQICTWALYVRLTTADPGIMDTPTPHHARAAAESQRTRASEAAAEPQCPPSHGEVLTTERPESSAEESAAMLAPEMFAWEGKALPMRTNFCRESKQYVARYDHYCPIINRPVGERNHCMYWWFCLFQLLSISSAVSILNDGSPTPRFQNGTAVLLSLVFIVQSLFVGALLVFHSWLVISNSTTYEFMRCERIEYLAGTQYGDLPFSQGVPRNVSVFCVDHGLGLLFYEWSPCPWSRPREVHTPWWSRTPWPAVPPAHSAGSGDGGTHAHGSAPAAPAPQPPLQAHRTSGAAAV